jgi:hypothetical protein
MDRDLGTPKKSQESTPARARVGACAGRFAIETNPPTPAWFSTRNAASSKAHDNDATFNKEFYR